MRRAPALLGRALVFGTLGALPLAGATLAQSPAQTARSFAPSPAVLGMGDAAVAFPTAGSSFFYNPAHLARTAGLKPRVALGVRAAGSTGLYDQVTFLNDEVRPAFDEGIENLDAAERDTLYTRALRYTRNRQYVGANVTLPTVTMRIGPVAAGVGVFTNTVGRYRTAQSSGPVPTLEASALFDVTGVASGALDVSRFGARGLTLGASAKLTRRFLTLKDKPFDTFGEEEQAYLHAATAVGLDLGALFEVPVAVPGRLTLGAAFFDAVSSGFEYRYTGRVACETGLCDDEGDVDAAEVAREEDLANDGFALHPSYRVGVAYTVPALFGLLGETGVALDYQGYARPRIGDQPLPARLHVGAQARLAKVLALRAGVSQGYTSVGAGLGLGPLVVDYAYYGMEEGRQPGELASWNHTVQLGLRF